MALAAAEFDAELEQDDAASDAGGSPSPGGTRPTSRSGAAASRPGSGGTAAFASPTVSAERPPVAQATGPLARLLARRQDTAVDRLSSGRTTSNKRPGSGALGSRFFLASIVSWHVRKDGREEDGERRSPDGNPRCRCATRCVRGWARAQTKDALPAKSAS